MSVHGRSVNGGIAKVFVDGEMVGKVDFSSDDTTPRIRFHRIFKGLGRGNHSVELRVLEGRAYVEGFATIR